MAKSDTARRPASTTLGAMRPRFGLSGTCFLVSAVILALEVGHIRLLSYAADPRLVYGAISIAFAGLGGGSIAIAVRPHLARGAVRPRLVRLASALGLAIVAHAAVFSLLRPALFGQELDRRC